MCLVEVVAPFDVCLRALTFLCPGSMSAACFPRPPATNKRFIKCLFFFPCPLKVSLGVCLIGDAQQASDSRIRLKVNKIDTRRPHPSFSVCSLCLDRYAEHNLWIRACYFVISQ